MDPRTWKRLTDPIKRRIASMLVRGVVSLINSADKMQTVQVQARAGDTFDHLEHFEPYGYTSNPKTGAEAILAAINGNRDHTVAIVIADRRYRLTSLKPGEVALYDDQGQKIYLTRAGIIVDGAGKQVTITNTPKTRMECDLDVVGEVKDLCDTSGSTLSHVRDVFDNHDHAGDSGGTTSKPNQVM